MAKDKENNGGAGDLKPAIIKAKISKIMVWPSRKVNLGNYSTVDLSAGLEITFDKAVDFDNKEIKEAFNIARRIISDEMLIQYKAFAPKKVVKPTIAKT